jgi:hypothetical protein
VRDLARAAHAVVVRLGRDDVARAADAPGVHLARRVVTEERVGPVPAAATAGL